MVRQLKVGKITEPLSYRNSRKPAIASKNVGTSSGLIDPGAITASAIRAEMALATLFRLGFQRAQLGRKDHGSSRGGSKGAPVTDCYEALRYCRVLSSELPSVRDMPDFRSYLQYCTILKYKRRLVSSAHVRRMFGAYLAL